MYDEEQLGFKWSEDESQVWVTSYDTKDLVANSPEELDPQKAPLYMELEDEFINAYRNPAIDSEDALEIVRDYISIHGPEDDTPFHIKGDEDEWTRGYNSFQTPDMDDEEFWFEDLTKTV